MLELPQIPASVAKDLDIIQRTLSPENRVASFVASQSQPTGTCIPAIHIPTTSEFLAQEFGDTEWLIDNLLPMGGSGIIVAKRESFKTWLSLYISECVLKGSILWGTFSTTQSNVLYVTNDDPPASFQRRLKHFDLTDGFYIYNSSLPSFSITGENGSFASVKTLIQEKHIGLMIVDILRNTHNKDSNTDQDAMAVFNRYKELREGNQNLVFLFVIHPSKENPMEKRFSKRKSEEAVGSYYWEASVDTVLSLTKTTTEDQTDTVFIQVTKNKQSEKKIKPFVGIRRKPDSDVEFIYDENLPQELKLDEAKTFIVRLLEDNQKIERQKIIDLVVESGLCRKRTAEEALSQLYDKKVITHTATKPYVYSFVQMPDVTKDSANRNSLYPLRNAESVNRNDSLGVAGDLPKLKDEPLIDSQSSSEGIMAYFKGGY